MTLNGKESITESWDASKNTWTQNNTCNLHKKKLMNISINNINNDIPSQQPPWVVLFCGKYSGKCNNKNNLKHRES